MLAYFGLFRVSELVFTTKEQSDKPLKATDVAFQNNSTLVRVIIRHSKTKQSGPPDILLIPCEKNAEWCPVCCYGSIVKFALHVMVVYSYIRIALH